MYTLANDSLEVSILDPVADQERFGVRYCTGGYIFQITDPQVGPLLSGPSYPESFNWFDGQGIPDAFNLAPLHESMASDALALIIGIGVCDLQAREVRSFCEWEIEQADHAITMRTSHSFQNFDIELERTVSLTQRTVRSSTRLSNVGATPFPMRWFPHPFYPQLENPQGENAQKENNELIKLNVPVIFAENEGYRMGASGFIERKGWPWSKGYYLPLDHGGMSNLVILQRHPTLGMVAATCSYIPAYFPIWGNPNTFSWEPFLEKTVGQGQELSWWIDYDF